MPMSRNPRRFRTILMSRIVLIIHRHDQLAGKYLIEDILREMHGRGHQVRVVRGIPPSPPSADLAILHVDATVVPREYVDLAASYPRCINLDVTDISKRRISGARLRPGDDWKGPVIVKSNANYGGIPEARLNQRALQLGEAPPFPAYPLLKRYDVATVYDVFDGIGDVPEDRLNDPARIVERFIPEPDPEGYALRFWVFFGGAERCNRFVSSHRILKSSTVVRWAPVEVPVELRRLRRELGFDYGKFDFVIHDGRPVLLDANKTLGRPLHADKAYAEQTSRFASGLEAMIP